MVSGEAAADDDTQEDLLILDHTTLQRTGPKALKRYRERDPRPASPILLLVPSGRKSDLTPDIWKRIDDVVQLPVRWPEMRSRIEVLVRMQSRTKEMQTYLELSAKYKVMLQNQQRQLNGYKDLFKNCAREILVLQEGEIIEATSRAEQLFGTEDLVGQTLLSLSPSQQPDGLNSKLKAEDLLDLSEGETQRAEWEFEPAEGNVFLSPVHLRCLKFKGEKCVRVLLTENESKL